MIQKIVKLIILFLLVAGIWAAWQLYTPAKTTSTDMSFVVAEGSGVNQISRELHEAGLIKSKLVFETYVWAIKAETRLIAGRYTLSTGWNIPHITDVLMGGVEESGSKVTIIEGWNRDEIGDYIASKGYSEETFLAITKSPADWIDDFPFLKQLPAGASLEGFLFPDTYNVNEYTTEETLVRRLLKNFENKADTSQANLFEAITLASIVELEVNQDDQRRIVAGIFANRLEAGIGLQSDATVNFVTGKSHRRPSLDDLEVDSPYNTYKYRGLPPGPISNPGLASIEAAFNPAQHDYLYFLHNQAGQIFYARTFEEHQHNRQLYLD